MVLKWNRSLIICINERLLCFDNTEEFERFNYDMVFNYWI